jgi:hypothetical protein
VEIMMLKLFILEIYLLDYPVPGSECAILKHGWTMRLNMRVGIGQLGKTRRYAVLRAADK